MEKDEKTAADSSSEQSVPTGNTGRKKGLENLRPWQPGQSGNPSGRPKKKPVTEIYEELLADPEVRDKIRDAILSRLLSSRMVGALEIKEATDRLEGKVVQGIDADITLSSLAERMQRAKDKLKS